MGKNVFANGREISGKAASNKTIAKMPDVCMSPPSPPAGPIPIPYPNFSLASDTTGGSKKVKIGGKEVGLKGKSSYKKSKGDMGATRSFGASIVSHVIEGSVKHQAGSFDVKIEGGNAVRFLDITTGNHSNAGLPPGPDGGGPAPGGPQDEECVTLHNENENTRKELKEKTSDKTLVGTDGKGKGTTVSSSMFKPIGGGSPTINSAHSNQKAYEKCGSLAKGGEMEDRKAGKSNLCEEAEHEHASPVAQKSGHAEARLLDELFKGGGARSGQITFNIDWRPKKGKPSKMPCLACHKMICAAKECDVEIYICDGQENPKPHRVPCPATPANRKALKKALGE